MAKYTITHSCGHEEMLELFGPRSQRHSSRPRCTLGAKAECPKEVPGAVGPLVSSGPLFFLRPAKTDLRERWKYITIGLTYGSRTEQALQMYIHLPRLEASSCPETGQSLASPGLLGLSPQTPLRRRGTRCPD